jgi:ketosteroid isomerase-like protein
MNSDDNIKLLRTAYEAFGRGDIPAVLDVIHDDLRLGRRSERADRAVLRNPAW